MKEKIVKIFWVYEIIFIIAILTILALTIIFGNNITQNLTVNQLILYVSIIFTTNISMISISYLAYKMRLIELEILKKERDT